MIYTKTRSIVMYEYPVTKTQYFWMPKCPIVTITLRELSRLKECKLGFTSMLF